MNTVTLKKTSEYLTMTGFKHSLSEKLILIDRDSIVNNPFIDKKNFDEENCYNALLEQLKYELNERFYYTGKSDDWLMLDVIPKKD